MARFRGRTVGAHEDRRTETARAAFIEARGEVEARLRAMEIGSLPRVEWRGQHLRAFRCTGETGRGPHAVNVPEGLLWALMDLRVYRCPFHA